MLETGGVQEREIVKGPGRSKAEPLTRKEPELRGEMPLHRSIYQQLLQEIQNGTWKVGDRLPSEAALCERFGASRTAVR